MLNEQGFNLWADGYDRSVGLSDEGNTYPFAGYKRVLNAITTRCWQTAVKPCWISVSARAR